MARGVRADTMEKYKEIMKNRRKAIPPRLGYAAGKIGISGTLLAELFKVSFKTMYDWTMCRTDPPEDMIPKMEKVALVCAVASKKGVNIQGSKVQRKRAFAKLIRSAIQKGE